jgi:hypothetical protein
MSFHVTNEAGEMYFPSRGWNALLQLARDYGWEPQGTLAPRIGQITDPYYWDLWLAWRNQARGAERRGEEPPTPPDIPEEAWTYEEASDWEGGYVTNDHQRVTDTDALALATALECALPSIPADDAEWVREFITFCKAGGFTIR